MTAQTKPRITVDEYLARWEGTPGRYELHDGVVYRMAQENVGHAVVKGAVQFALAKDIRARGLPCHMLPNGITVRIDDLNAYDPDALVYCGTELPPSALVVPNPIIVAEVRSPTTQRIDTFIKLAGYFRLPSVAHYLIVDPAQPLILLHARAADGSIVTRTVRDGTIALDPPGMELAVADVYAPG